MTFIILAEKKYLKLNPQVSILKLTCLGTIICFYTEVIFQILRQPFVNTISFTGHLYYISIGAIVITIFMGAISFLVAFQLKTKRTAQLLFFIIGFLIIINLTKHFIPNAFGPY
ncbi:hypothetical protein A5893_13845 [Pedobacter psychrophilus]|uniref:Uncharacterized protein n=1 Tax=Pedobacter psychrophilus TaxID=1826909 RepID=A0A179DDF7_9SPHI|nr:hypothetical protein A5893_13845 [Pedobacter psychrophilus]